MKTWIGLLRGINVGGKNLIRMADLKTTMIDSGLTDVRTYIQSGNLLFRSKSRTRASVQNSLTSLIFKQFGLEVPAIALTYSDLQQAIARNPFPAACSNPKTLHVAFLESTPKQPDWEKLDRIKSDSESYELIGDTFYSFTPNGVGRSKMSAQMEKCLGVRATARNWRTLDKLAQMAKEMEQ